MLHFSSNTTNADDNTKINPLIGINHAHYINKRRYFASIHPVLFEPGDSMVSMFECDQCDYKSKTKAALVLHIKYLHDTIKHCCLACGSQFSVRSNLIRHENSLHEGTKYPCGECDYIGRGIGRLRRHIQFIHEGKTYHCGTCYLATETEGGQGSLVCESVVSGNSSLRINKQSEHVEKNIHVRHVNTLQIQKET